MLLVLMINIKINNQVKTILNDFNSASECNHISIVNPNKLISFTRYQWYLMQKDPSIYSQSKIEKVQYF